MSRAVRSWSRRQQDGAGGAATLRRGGGHGRPSLGEVVFPQTPADRCHIGAGDGEPQPGEHVRGRVRGAVQDAGGHQDHPESRSGGNRVQLLEVSDLLARRRPWRGCAGEGGHYLDPRGGQPEHAVERRQVPADIGGGRGLAAARGKACRGAGGRDRGKDRHRLTAAIDPLVQQGLDAVRDPEQVRGITGARVKQAAGSRGGRRRADGHGRSRAARVSSTSCRQDHTQEHRDGEQVRSP